MKNKKNQVKLILVFFVAVLILGAGRFGSAQAPPSTEGGEDVSAEATLVATVNVFDATFSSSEGHVLDVSFALSNRVGVQSGVKYGVELWSSDEQIMVDQLIYPEIETLGENSMVKKTVKYLPPEYLSGKYEVWVKSESESGLPLGRSLAGEIELAGDEKYIKIEKCSLKVGDKSDAREIGQLTYLSPDEELMLICAFENRMDANLNVTPHFKINRYSAYGPIALEEDGQSIELKKGASQVLRLNIPKVKSPQIYDATISFSSADGEKVSNSIEIRYVIRGNSATIKNLTLSQDSFSKGDVAKIALFWSGRADKFMVVNDPNNDQEKTMLKIDMMDGKGASCAENFSKELNPDEFIENVQLNVTDDCKSGKLVATLMDEKGTVMSEETVQFQKSAVTPETKNKKDSIPIPYLIAGLFFVIGMIAIFFKKKQEGGKMILLIFSLALLGSFLATHGVQADSWTGPPYSAYRPVFYGSLDKSSYCRNTRIVASGGVDGWGAYCTDVQFGTSVTINGSSGNLGSFYYYGPYDNIGCGSGPTTITSRNFTAQNSVGNFTAAFNGRAQYYNGPPFGTYTTNTGHNIGYSVVDCTPPSPVNGSCGSAQGGDYTTQPTSGRCSSGNASTPALNARETRWNWTCNGSNGGSTASCWANNNPSPFGFHDGRDNASCSIWGWAMDNSNRNQSLMVRVRYDGSPGTLIGDYLANVPRPDVQAYYGTAIDQYGFNISLRGTAVDDGNQHSVSVRAIDIPGTASNTLLSGSPKNIRCAPSNVTASLVANPSSGASPLPVVLTTTVGGPATGSITYVFDCKNGNAPVTQIDNNIYSGCSYSGPATYNPTVAVTRGGSNANASATVSVSACVPGSKSYSCNPGFCSSTDNCKNKAGVCVVSDGCSTSLDSASVCRDNGTACKDSTACYCPDKDWIEVAP